MRDGVMRDKVSMKRLYINGHYEFVEDLADALSWVEALGGYDLREYLEEYMDDAISDEVEKRVRDVVGCVERAQFAIEKAIMKLERR